MPDSPVDSGYRWAVVTPEDRSGIVYIVVFLSFTYSSLTFITRLFIKWHILGLDDGAIAIAQIASLVQFGLVLTSLSAGLAKSFDSLTNNEYIRMVSTQYGNQIALYLSLGFSKISTILLTQRLFTRDMKMAWLLCQVVSVVVVLWTIVAPFLVSVGCSPASLAPATPSATCPNIINRYRILVITDAITDVILVVIPASLCWQLQMNVALKLQVFAVFAFRLPLVVLSALFLKTWKDSLSSTDPGVSRSSAVVFQQAELCLSLMAATIPCLKSFIRSFDTGSGVKASFGSSNGYGRGSQNDNGRTQSYKMSSMNRSKMTVSRSESQTRLKNDDEDGRHNRSFTSGRMSPPTTTRSKSHRDIDRESQGCGPELFIRRDMQFEVKSEHSHDPSSAVFRGMPL